MWQIWIVIQVLTAFIGHVPDLGKASYAKSLLISLDSCIQMKQAALLLLEGFLCPKFLEGQELKPAQPCGLPHAAAGCPYCCSLHARLEASAVEIDLLAEPAMSRPKRVNTCTLGVACGDLLVNTARAEYNTEPLVDLQEALLLSALGLVPEPGRTRGMTVAGVC